MHMLATTRNKPCAHAQMQGRNYLFNSVPLHCVQTCDYWGEEEDYSCKSLEEEYGCDCFGCKCAVDHEPCDNKLARKTCEGKTCDEWVLE